MGSCFACFLPLRTIHESLPPSLSLSARLTISILGSLQKIKVNVTALLILHSPLENQYPGIHPKATRAVSCSSSSFFWLELVYDTPTAASINNHQKLSVEPNNYYRFITPFSNFFAVKLDTHIVCTKDWWKITGLEQSNPHLARLIPAQN